MMLTTILAALAISLPSGASVAPVAGFADRHRVDAGPYVEVWANEEDTFRRGQQIRVYFRTSQDAYVTIFRIDTDGRVRVLYPVEPWEDNFARGGQRYETRDYGDRYSFVVDDYPGQGYIFGVASKDPFSYNVLARGDHWDYREIAAGGRITGDPYVALTDLVDRIVPPNYSEYSYDILPYYVEQRYEYPRFLCYDCHSYASYPYWNPYERSCFRFRVVIYDDFYYNPVRYGGRARYVYTQNTRIAPRYVFKDRAGGGAAEPFVTRVRAQPVDPTGRRVLIDPGVRGRDVGGVGQVPSPTDRRRQLPDVRTGGSNTGGVDAPQRRSIGDGSQAPDAGRRLVPDQSQPDRGVVPSSDSPRRRPETGEVQRRPAGDDTPARQLPQLERRGEAQREPDPRPAVTPRREPERRPDIQPRREPERQAEPRAEPRREAPSRPVERPEPERRQPEARQPERQPEARQPENRPAPKKEPENSEGGRRRPQDP